MEEDLTARVKALVENGMKEDKAKVLAKAMLEAEQRQKDAVETLSRLISPQ